MTGEIDFQREIFSRFGCVKRARLCYLYTEKGVRLTDLCLANGRAILGWGAGMARQYLKNSLAKNASWDFPSRAESRLKKTLKKIFPAFSDFAFFQSEFDAACALGLPKNENFFETLRKNQIPLFVSGANSPLFAEKNDFAIIFPPFPWGNFAIAGFYGEAAQKGERIPSAVLEAIDRAYCDSLLPKRQILEKTCAIFDKSLEKCFERQGFFLFPKVLREDYEDFFRFCLDLKVFISPNFDMPSISPYLAADGDFSALKKADFGGKNEF